MSTKALGRVYSSMAHPAVGGGGVRTGEGGLLSSLFGQDIIRGGPEMDPTTGELVMKPYTASGGIFGGPARRMAFQMNAQGMGMAYQAQIQKQIIEMEGKIKKELGEMGTKWAKELQDNETINALAKERGVPPEQILGTLSPLLGQIAYQKGKLE